MAHVRSQVEERLNYVAMKRKGMNTDEMRLQPIRASRDIFRSIFSLRRLSFWILMGDRACIDKGVGEYINDQILRPNLRSPHL